MRITMRQKLEMAKAYDTGKYKLLELCRLYGVSKDKIQYTYQLYKMWGEKPFLETADTRVYSREEKLEAIKIVLSKEKSSRRLSLEKGMLSPRVLQDWVNLYLEKGESAIQNSRSRKKYMLHADRQRYLAERELRERLKFLEMENEYLKKSLALGSRKGKQQRKKLK